MKHLIMIITALAILALTSCMDTQRNADKERMPAGNVNLKSGYSDVNGLKMYYEIYGDGKPLVLIHGGGSTIQSTFGKVIPLLSQHRQLIAVELQAHGRTSDRTSELSFEQDADDVATLLKNLNISKADFFGFSNGGTTALQIAIRHPDLVDKIIAASALCKRNGIPSQFWDLMEHASLDNMPAPLKDAYLEVAPDSSGLQVMFDKDAKRMVGFRDIPDEEIQSIQVPTLIIISDKDVITPEHAVVMHRLITGSRLAILPGGHGEYIGEITTGEPDVNVIDFVISMIEDFIDETPGQP